MKYIVLHIQLRDKNSSIKRQCPRHVGNVVKVKIPIQCHKDKEVNVNRQKHHSPDRLL